MSNMNEEAGHDCWGYWCERVTLIGYFNHAQCGCTLGNPGTNKNNYDMDNGWGNLLLLNMVLKSNITLIN